MYCYNYCDNSEKIFTYSSINTIKRIYYENIIETKVEVTIFTGVYNLQKLVNQMFNVVDLTLIFSDSYSINIPEPDLSSFASLKNLKNLTISHAFNLTPKLRNLKSLEKSSLDKLIVYGKKLNPKNIVYPWFSVRIKNFDHIENIDSEKYLTTYYINFNPEFIKILSTVFEIDPECFTSKNVLLQKNRVTKTYTVTYAVSNKIQLKKLTKKQFLQLILCKVPKSTTVNYPKVTQDLYQTDTNSE